MRHHQGGASEKQPSGLTLTAVLAVAALDVEPLP
jgi:hypothetical protein